MSTKPLKVNCPSCQKTIEWVESNTHRPFCSERCQQIDLGAWASESYAIPAEPQDEWSIEPLSESVSESDSTPYSLQ